ncbi:MAG: response regulator [Planctomycetia bacterium]|nr:response regulator [Planctomycetia bacterium]
MSTISNLRRALVLSGPGFKATEVYDNLARNYDVVVCVSTMEEAVAELRKGSFEIVMSQAADFLPLERAHGSLQSEMVLDTIGEGVCMINPAGRMVWSNRRMKQWSPEVIQRISAACMQAIAAFTAPPAAHLSEHHVFHSRKFAISIGDSQFFELVCSPVHNQENAISHVVAVCWDATHTRRLQQQLDAIDQAGRELVRLEKEAIAKLNFLQRQQLLEERIIKFLRQLMHFDHFNIRLLDPASNKLEPVMAVGMPEEAMEVELFCEAEGNGICGYVAATGRSYISPDVAKDPRYVAGLDTAKSSLTVPLMLYDKTIGVLNIESDQYAFFTEDDRQFAEIFGRYVAIALNVLDLLMLEQRTSSGKLVQEIACEVSGPLNDMIYDLEMVKEANMDNAALSQAINTILVNANTVRNTFWSMCTSPQQVFGAHDERRLPQEDPRLRGKRILVADDQANIRETIHFVLTHCGCIVDTATDGADALAHLAGQPRYDLVLSDIRMPHKNGYEVFAAAQKIGHNPPVILMTGFGYDPDHSIVQASKEGLAAVLSKPFKVERLMQEIFKALAIA